MKPQDYEIIIRPLAHEDGGGYLATAPDLPGCMSDGETPEEALVNVYDAVMCWMEAAREMGGPIPEPKLKAAWSRTVLPAIDTPNSRAKASDA